jgi:hypothetical protein
MLQVFHLNVAEQIKMLYMLQWLYTYVSSVCSECFICFSRRMFASIFIWMLHMFLQMF